MARTLLILVLIALTASIVRVFFWQKPVTFPPATAVLPVPASTPTPSPDAQSAGRYRYRIFPVLPADRLVLIPNFTDPLPAGQLASINSCRAYINGAFYDTQNRPLGMFVTDKKVIRNRTQNRLIDAFLWEKDDQRQLDFAGPEDPALSLWILQTGPMLFADGKKLMLNIRNDEEARRMVVMTDNQKKLYFVTVFDPQSVFFGPLLADLPDVIEKISILENIDTEAAANLDGGSASAFSDGVNLFSELTSVGSLFCLK